VTNGQQMLQQFLRLHAASQWLEEGNKGSSKGNSKAGTPAQTLASGQPVDIAGYTLSPTLASGLGAARLQAIATETPGRMVWLETSTQPEPSLGPGSTAHLDAWRVAGWAVSAQAVNGRAFWQTVGTDEAPALVAATLQAMTKAAEPVA